MTKLLDRLDAEHSDWLRRCGDMATARGSKAYLVGGSVRDLILEREQDDIDIVVEGDGMEVAQDLSRAMGGNLTRYHAFQTAIVTAPSGLRFDLTTARREAYRKPGQLPQVIPGTIKEDLERRDFTINTMAISISRADFGEFLDPCGGLADLHAGRIRVMHLRSFADDPTRVLRALRFSVRLGYTIDATTRGWMHDAITGGYLDTVSGERVRKEIALVLGEAPIDGALRLATEGALEAIHKGLRADEQRLRDLQEAIAWYRCTLPPGSEFDEVSGWSIVLGCCAAGLSPQERWDLARRLRLSREERAPLIDSGAPWRRAVAQLPAPPVPPSNSVVERAFRGIDDGALLVGAVSIGIRAPEADAVRLYLADLRGVQPDLKGADLRKLGVPEGPRVGEFLQKLRAARLDGNATNVADERRLVSAWLAEKPLQ